MARKPLFRFLSVPFLVVGVIIATVSPSVIASDDTFLVQRGITGKGEGNDIYVLSPNLIDANAQITITDTQGNNSLQLIGGLNITSSLIASDAVQLTLNNGAIITVLGAGSMTYTLGGDPLNGIAGSDKNYQSFVADALGASIPTTGTASGGSSLINSDGTTEVTPVTDTGDGADDDTSGSGGASTDNNTSGGQASKPVMRPSTSITLGRDLDVLVLSSNTTDQRPLQQHEIDTSFELVKEVLAYNQVINNYRLTYAQYDTSMSSEAMMSFFDNHNGGDSAYPESYALSLSEWVKDQQNIDLMNSADIIVLRTSFNSDNTSGAFWGAATGQAIIWPHLSKIAGLNNQKVFLNAPIDPDTSGYPYPHNAYLEEDLKINRFDRIFAHEFIHALGYGAHDNGVDFHQTEAFSEQVKSDLAYAETVGETLSYGDCFSIMGNAECSLMLSPSAKEFLGASLDFVAVYDNSQVTLSDNQLLKVFLSESLEANGFETVLNYVTLERPKTEKYGQTLNGDIELADAIHNLQRNMNGYLVRMVKVNITAEATPNVILVDGSPPLNDVTYTLQAGEAIDIGNHVRIEYLSKNNGVAEFRVTYL